MCLLLARAWKHTRLKIGALVASCYKVEIACCFILFIYHLEGNYEHDIELVYLSGPWCKTERYIC